MWKAIIRESSRVHGTANIEVADVDLGAAAVCDVNAVVLTATEWNADESAAIDQ